MQQKIINLESEAKTAKRYRVQVEEQRKVILDLQEQLNDCELEIQEMKKNEEDYLKQASHFQNEKNSVKINAEEQIEVMRKQSELIKTKYNLLKSKTEHLIQLRDSSQQELAVLRDKVGGYENNILGLPQALKELRELRAMVQLRDKQIAELVSKVNQDEKIMTGLAMISGLELNIEKFLQENDERLQMEEEKRVEIATRELEAKIATMRLNGPIHSIKIIS